MRSPLARGGRPAATYVAWMVCLAPLVVGPWPVHGQPAPARAPSGGTVLVDEEAGFTLGLPRGMSPITAAPTDEARVLAAFADARGRTAAIVRSAGSLSGARELHPAFLAKLEVGLGAGSPGWRKLRARSQIISPRKTPVHDVWFQRTVDGARTLVGARFLFVSGGALTLIVEVPGPARSDRAAQALLDSFAPLAPR